MIFVTGDLHGHLDIHKLNTKRFPIQKKLTKDDYVIVCGDFGLVWGGEYAKEDRHWQKWLNEKTFTTLFVDGNHENHDLLQQYPVTEWHGGKMHQIQPSVLHLMRGQVFEINGRTFFTMGGAASHDKKYRTEGRSWWPGELPSKEEYTEAERNLAEAGWKVDYILTHCAPTSVQSYFGAGSYAPDPLTNFLESLYERVQWQMWYLGHYHVDKPFGKYRILYDDIIEIPME